MLDLITLPYARPRWSGLIRLLFAEYEERETPLSIPVPENSLADSIHQLGVVTIRGNQDGETLSLAVIEIVASDAVALLRNRVGIRNLAARLLSPGTADGLLVATTQPGKDAWRFTFIHREARFTQDGGFERVETPTRRFTYVLGPDESCRTPDSRFQLLARHRGSTTLAHVLDAFSVEKLSDEFFTTYKEHYKHFCAHLIENTDLAQTLGIQLAGLEGKERDRALKPIRDFVKKLLGRLVFLHFIQKKGWLGCPPLVGEAATLPQESMPWIEGTPDFLREMFQTAPPDEQQTFHSSRLVPLFFNTLNAPDREGLIFPITGTRVPYLNGGLFEPDFPGVETVHFPALLFAALLEFFRQYHFTIDENDPEDHEIGIDPEMLGRIFENLLEDNKDKGAYYTPKPVVQYMCQQSLIHALIARYPGDAEAPAEIERLVRYKEPIDSRQNSWLARHATELSAHLDDLRICDPAIGSGAFPIGLLQEIYWIKLTLNPSLDRAHAKRGIIQHCIHGVDLDAGAVEIARLRFWLALIVDEDVPSPLPNLDYQIMQGNSLLESFEGEPLDKLAEPVRAVGRQRLGSDVLELDLGGSASPGELTLTIHTPAQYNLAELREEYYACHNPTEKAALRARIDAAVLQAIDARFTLRREELLSSLRVIDSMAERKHLRGGDKKRAAIQAELDALAGKSARLHSLLENPRSERPFFLWHLWFRQILADAPEGRGGFDIVIANPPYISHEKIPADQKAAFASCFSTYNAFADIYCYFLELSTWLLNERGIGVFITSNSYIKADYGRSIRARLGGQTLPLAILNVEDTQVFQSAIVNTAILIFSNKADTVRIQGSTTITDAPLEHASLFAHVEEHGQAISSHYLKSPFWVLAGEQTLKTKAAIERAGLSLANQGAKIRLGIATGHNEAFVIDEVRRNHLVGLSSSNESLIKPLLRGRDIGRYGHLPPSKFILLTQNGVNVPRDYPTLVPYFEQFGGQFKSRGARGQNWWNLRACAFYDDFERDRIVWIELSDDPRFALCEAGTYLLNTAYFILPPADVDARALLAVLNSKVIFFFFRLIAQTSGMGTTRWFKEYVSAFPVPFLSIGEQATLSTLVDSILAAKRMGDEAAVKELEDRIDTHVFRLYGLTPEEIALVRGASA